MPARLPVLNWPPPLQAEAPVLRAYLVHPGGVTLERLQKALKTKLSANDTNSTKTAWKDIAEQNQLASLSNLTEPTWACSGPSFWAAIAPLTHETVDVFMGFRTTAGPNLPDVANLARFGPVTLAAVFRHYAAFHRQSPSVAIQMIDGGREAEMTMTLRQWQAMLLERAVLAVPGAFLVNGIGGALTLYVKNEKLGEAVTFFAVVGVIGLVAWLVSAVIAARGKPRWERGAWEAE